MRHLSLAAFVLSATLVVGPVRAQNNIDLPENKAALKITERYLLKTVVPADCLAFSHDGKKLMSTISRAQPKNRDAWKELTVWDLTQEKPVALQKLTGHPAKLLTVAFSKDGAKAIGVSSKEIKSRLDTQVFVWDIGTGQIDKNFAVEGLPIGLSLFGTRLLTRLDDRTMTVLDLAKEVKTVFSLKMEEVFFPTLSPDGTLLAGTTTQTAHVWDVATGKEEARFASAGKLNPRTEFFHSLWFSGDSKMLCGLWDSHGGVSCWNLREKKLIGQVSSHESVGDKGWPVSPDAHYMLCRLREGQALLSLRSGKRVAELERKEFKTSANPGLFSPDGRFVAVSGMDGICIWELPKELPE